MSWRWEEGQVLRFSGKLLAQPQHSKLLWRLFHNKSNTTIQKINQHLSTHACRLVGWTEINKSTLSWLNLNSHHTIRSILFSVWDYSDDGRSATMIFEEKCNGNWELSNNHESKTDQCGFVERGCITSSWFTHLMYATDFTDKQVDVDFNMDTWSHSIYCFV